MYAEKIETPISDNLANLLDLSGVVWWISANKNYLVLVLNPTGIDGKTRDMCVIAGQGEKLEKYRPVAGTNFYSHLARG